MKPFSHINTQLVRSTKTPLNKDRAPTVQQYNLCIYYNGSIQLNSFKCQHGAKLEKRLQIQMTLSKHWLYIYIFFFSNSENLKAFTIYTVLIVYYTVHTENDVYGAPHSDKNPAQTGSSYQAVCLFISLHHRAVRRHWELRFHWRTVGSVLSHWQR